MNNKKQKNGNSLIIVIILINVAIVISSVWYAVQYDTSAPKKIDDLETIQTLENSDPNYQKEIKEIIANMISDNYGEKPEKVVFYVHTLIKEESYKIDIYYKINGEWFNVEKSPNNEEIPEELDKMLKKIT